MERHELKKKLQVARLTPQRELLFHLIKKHADHLHVSELYQIARKMNTKINLATVYRTLKEFKKVGIVDELHLEEEHHHYETAAKEKHHHLLCERCGTVLDFTTAYADKIKKEIAKQHGSVVSQVRIQATGFCKKCKKL